ncbi:hypothetical protein TWF694_010180, partial [Orbilia ellipsospora]
MQLYYVFGVLGTVVAYFVWSKISLWLRERKFRKSHGTQPPNYLKTKLPLGLDHLTTLLNQIKRQNAPEFVR